MINIPLKVLLEKLDQLSADLVSLNNYQETKDARLLWTSGEGEIVKKEEQNWKYCEDTEVMLF